MHYSLKKTSILDTSSRDEKQDIRNFILVQVAELFAAPGSR